MQVRAIARNLRVSPDKVRLVISEIKKMPPAESVKILDFVQKKSSKMIKKTILSAVANAKNNFGLDEESLTFKEITVGKGMVFKRMRPIARGRGHSILRRTSNLTVILEGEEKKKTSEVSKVEESKVTKEPFDKSQDKPEEPKAEKNEKSI